MRRRIWRRTQEPATPRPLEYRSAEDDRQAQRRDGDSGWASGLGSFLATFVAEAVLLIVGVFAIVYLRGCWANV